MRSRYWSCTNFANKLRGVDKPYALQWGEWDKWHDKVKAEHPIRYWLAEEALDMIQKVIYYPVDRLYDVKYYLVNRFITQTHCLPSTLKKGQWHEFDERILYSMFDTLVDFVEVETAWNHIAWNEEYREKYKAPFWAFGWFRTRQWRCPEAGVDNLEWASSLTNEDTGEPTGQAIVAKKTLELYNWWKTVRPNRPDADDVSGLTEYYTNKQALGESLRTKSDEDRDAWEKMYNECHRIETEYNDEDERMLIDLIKIRKGLWT